jgi:GNAT superfamily N-acetyltransferase
MSEWSIAPLPKGALADARRVLQEACAFDKAHLVAEEKLFGEAAGGLESSPLGAYVDGKLVGVAAVSDRWLRLLAVVPEHRGRGIGSGLLQASLKQIKTGSQQARTMDQPGNYLSPGIDKRNDQTIAWLQKRGFSTSGEACNLVISLTKNELVSEQHYLRRKSAAQDAGYRIQRLEAQQVSSSAALITANFSVGWVFEIRLAAQCSPPAVHVAVHQASGEVVAFAAHDGNNQGTGSFGPAGTLEPHRGQGLGAALLLACLLDIQAAGLAHAEVAWIGPRDFYDKIAGIESERHFTIMTKDLTHEDDND